MRKQGGGVVRAQSTWPENANDREVLGNYALCPRNNDNSAEFCANIPLWCGCYLHTTKTTKHAFESTFHGFLSVLLMDKLGKIRRLRWKERL